MSHQPDNIFAGTQIVSLVEIRGTNNSLVHPRGAVGVVTRTPTGDQNQFLVRFYPLLFATFSGAYLYGFPSPGSDCDLKVS
jgi:RNA repair pathway DNA polymerase beta family